MYPICLARKNIPILAVRFASVDFWVLCWACLSLPAFSLAVTSSPCISWKYRLPYPVAHSLTSGSICRHKSLHQCIFYRTWKTGFLRKLPVDRTDYTDWFRLPSCHLLYAGSCWRQNGCTRCCDRWDGRHILRGQLLYLVPKKAESSEQIAR